MRFAAACLVGLAFASAAFADPGAGRVRGVVMRGADEAERPDAGREVTLARAGAPTATTKTDAWGGFSFECVPAGAACEVRVEAEGCAPVRLADVVLQPNETWDVGLLALRLPLPIDVFVADEHGKPLPGAAVEAFREGDSGALADFRARARLDAPRTPVVTATTGADGRVRLAVGVGATWTVAAHAEGRVRDAQALIFLHDDRPRRVAFALPKARRLTGVVRDDDGKPVAGALVLARKAVRLRGPCGNAPLDESAALWQRATADAAGRFAFETLPPGALTVLAAPPGAAPLHAATVEFPAIREVALTLPPSGTLFGRVVDEADGAPLAGVIVAQRSAFSASRTVTGADGRWRLDGVDVDQGGAVYSRFEVDPPDGWTDFRWTTEELSERLAPGQTQRFDGTLARAATVVGRVTRGGAPFGGATVEAVTVPERGENWRGRRTDGRVAADGAYRIEGVLPGLVVVHGAEAGADSYAEWDRFRKEVLDDATARARVAVPAGPGATVERDVEVAPPRPSKWRELLNTGGVDARSIVVRLRVTTADGAPLVDGKWDYARGDDDFDRGFWNDLGPGGVAEGEAMVWEETRIHVHAWDDVHGRATKDVEIRPETKEVEVELVLPPRATLKARAVADGKPVAGADVLLGGWMLVARSGADGVFEVPLDDEGKATVEVVADGFFPSSLEDARPAAQGAFDVELRRAAAIEGVVVDADGRGVAGLVVEDRDAGRMALTELGGRFRVLRVPVGERTLRVSSPAGCGARVETKDASVAAGAKDARILVLPEWRVEGRVVSADGTPVRAEVVVRPGPAGDEKAQTRTDAKGRFAFPGLRDGDFELSIEPLGKEAVPAKRSVKGGETVEIVVESMSEIRGVVRTASGGVPPRMEVRAVRLDKPSEERRDPSDWIDEKDGSFRIVVPPHARFRLVPDGGTRVQVATLKGGEDVASGTVDLKLVADPGMTIAGVVLDENGKPLSGADVEATLGPRQYRRLRTQEDGRFELGGMGECIAIVEVTSPGRVPFREMLKSGTTGLSVALKPGKSIAGRLLDAAGAPAAHVWVRARSASWPGADLWRAQPKDDGRFEIDGLDEGEWTIEAGVPGCMTYDVNATFGPFKAGARDVELRLPK